MHRYNIHPEILRENLVQLQFGSTTFEEEFKNVPAKDKAIVAKMYNAMFKSSIERVKKRREKEFKDKIDPDLEDPDQVVQGEDSDESDIMIQVKPKNRKRKR